MSAIGIRRLPGTEMNVEEFKMDVRKHRPSEVVGLLSSLVQGSSFAKWSNISTDINDVLGDLTTDIHSVMQNENTADQEALYTELNKYQYWIGVRIEAEEAATSAEKILALAVDDEKTKAEAFITQAGIWKSSMLESYPLCKDQQDDMDFEEDVNPQSTFECKFDAIDTDELNCDKAFNTYSENVTSEVGSLNTSYLGAKVIYLAKEAACQEAIGYAEGNFSDTKVAYNLWEIARDVVADAYNRRKQIVCQDTVPSCDTYGDILDTAYDTATGHDTATGLSTSYTVQGLDYSSNSECSAGKEIERMKDLIEGFNNSESLGDRNYELHSLNIIHCLLEKISSFNSGEWQDENVTKIVTECSSEDGTVLGGGEWDKFPIHFDTTGDDRQAVPASNFDTKCFVQTKSVESFSDLQLESVCDLTLESKTDVKVSYLEDENSASSATLFSLTGLGIPSSFKGDVSVHSEWSMSTNDDAALCVKYLCPRTVVDNVDTAPASDCLDHVIRTELRCDLSGGSKQTLKSGHFKEYDDVVLGVPTVYTTGVASSRKISAGRIAGCTV